MVFFPKSSHYSFYGLIYAAFILQHNIRLAVHSSLYIEAKDVFLVVYVHRCDF